MKSYYLGLRSLRDVAFSTLNWKFNPAIVESRSLGHLNLMCRRCLSSAKRETKKIKLRPKPPAAATSDLIGPPDSTSNIRPVRFYIPPDESPIEKNYRLQRADVLEWNQKFWADHNSKFFKEKEEYIQSHKSDSKDGKGKLSPEQLSVFYKGFLNENRVAHLNYNREWYKKNVSLLWPALKVAVIRMKRKLTGKR